MKVTHLSELSNELARAGNPVASLTLKIGQKVGPMAWVMGGVLTFTDRFLFDLGFGLEAHQKAIEKGAVEQAAAQEEAIAQAPADQSAVEVCVAAPDEPLEDEDFMLPCAEQGASYSSRAAQASVAITERSVNPSDSRMIGRSFIDPITAELTGKVRHGVVRAGTHMLVDMGVDKVFEGAQKAADACQEEHRKDMEAAYSLSVSPPSHLVTLVDGQPVQASVDDEGVPITASGQALSSDDLTAMLETAQSRGLSPEAAKRIGELAAGAKWNHGDIALIGSLLGVPIVTLNEAGHAAGE